MRNLRIALQSAAVLLVTWMTATSSFGFDICIYKDPLTYWTEHFLFERRTGTYTGSPEGYLSLYYSPAQMDSVYKWYRDMGVTRVMVIYPFQENYDWILGDSTNIKTMNWFYPGQGTMHGDKYVNGQFRVVNVGLDKDQLPTDPLRYWSYHDAIRDPAQRISEGGPTYFDQNFLRPVVEMSGTPDTLWRATSELGTMSGWDFYTTGWLDSSFHMPMHYRLTWAVDPEGPISTNTTLASFYWMVQIPQWRLDAGGLPAEAKWWRYPAKNLKLDGPNGVADSTNWIVSNFYEDAVSGVYSVLDESFHVLLEVSWDEIHYGPARIPNSLDLNAELVSWGTPSKVRMSVYYQGTHNFYLNRIEVYDEGTYRMFTAPDSAAYHDSIASAFQQEWNYAQNRSAGWWYPEWDLSGVSDGNPVLRSIVKVNKILADRNMPTMYVNGYGGELSDTVNLSGSTRTMFYGEEDRQGVEIPFQSNEFYFLGASNSCQPIASEKSGWPAPLHMWTSYASDTTEYIHADACLDTIDGGQRRYVGFKSLQCSIDGSIWEWDPIFALGNMDMPPNMTELPHWFNLRHQVELRDWRRAHGHNDKFIADLAGDTDGADGPDNCCPIRTPSTNEVKLMAWLAVACDVDGIMWYPFHFGGLIDIDGTNFFRTERYYAARDVCTKIQSIAPIFESLDYVKTYASRAFETNYPNSAYEATQLDTLATNCTWYEQDYRAVEAIVSWAPNGQGGWVQDSNSYVQISRFRNPLIDAGDSSVEDYWFLVVNRRALEGEQRKIRLVLESDTACLICPYFIDYILGDSTVVTAGPCADRTPTCATRYIDVLLQPGEAELVHFYRGHIGCESSVGFVEHLTVSRESSSRASLRWSPVVGADVYFVCGSPRPEGPWTPFAFTHNTTFVDSVFTSMPKYFYTIQACTANP